MTYLDCALVDKPTAPDADSLSIPETKSRMCYVI